MLASIRRYFLCTYLKKTPYKKKSHEPSPKKAIAAKFQKRNQLHKLTTKTDSKSTPSLPGVPKALIAPEPLATRALLHFSADFDEGLGALAESLVRRLSFLAAEQKVHRTDGKIHFSAKFSDFSVKSGETAGLFALRSVSLHLARQPVATHSDFRRLCTAVCWEELVPPLTWPQIRVRAEGKASGLDNALALKAILCEKIFASANDRREPLVAVSLAAKAENPRRRPFLTAGGGRRERKRAKIEERREQVFTIFTFF